MKKIENVLPVSSSSQLLVDLIETIAKLRDPESGCPWDLEQDFQSLRQYMLEEAYEASAAMNSNDGEELCDELGDVLLQVVLNSQIASEQQIFTLADVIDNLNKKMIRRHPHVFTNKSVNDSDEVIDNWQKIKASESSGKKLSIKPNFPALKESVNIGKETKKKSFDWGCSDEVLLKVKEEVAELEEAMKAKDQTNINEELGDLLFSVAQLSRHLKLDPEVSLQSANIKFLDRFSRLVALCESENTSLEEMHFKDKEVLWSRIKKIKN